jgi:predicted nucleic acid-binding protein
MIVADTSLVAYLAIPGAATQDAERIRAKDRRWTAPPLIRFQMMNVVARELHAGNLARDAALRVFRRGINLVSVSTMQSDPLFIFNAVRSTGCSTYDLEFVWLAMELGVPLVTADQQLIKAFPDVAVDLRTFG